MMNKPELKTCPFCGEEAKYVCENMMSVVRCTNQFCRAIGPFALVSDDYISRDHAIEKWNRRASNEAD